MGRNAGVTIDIGFRAQVNDLFKDLKGPLGKLSDLVEGSGLSNAIKDEVKNANTELESLFKGLNDKYDELVNGKIDTSSFEAFKKTTQNRLSELSNKINELTNRFNDFQEAMSGLDSGSAGRGVVELSQKFTEFREQVLGANKLLSEFMNIAQKRNQPISFIDTSAVKQSMDEIGKITTYLDDIEDTYQYDQFVQFDKKKIVDKFKEADKEISRLQGELFDAEDSGDNQRISEINKKLIEQIQIINSLRLAYEEVTKSEYNFADMSNFKNKAGNSDRFDSFVSDVKDNLIRRRQELQNLIEKQSAKTEAFVDVEDFSIKNGTISVPLKLSTTAQGLKSEVNGILDAVQSSIEPIEVKFKLTSGYNKYKTDELKEAEELENQINGLDIPNETKQNLLNLTSNIREAFGKELKINIRENSADVANTIKNNIKNLQTELNAQPIKIQLKVDDDSKNKVVQDIIDVKNGNNTEEKQSNKLPKLLTSMSQYMNAQGDVKGNGFWQYLQDNLEGADGAARKLLTSLGLISKNDEQINIINNGGTNRGGIIGPENTVIARSGTVQKYEEALKLKDALDQASEAGVQCSRILNVVFDKSSGIILELQKTMSGEPISNIGLFGQEKDTKFNEAILRATDKQILKLIEDLETLNKLGIDVDFNDSNFLFDETKGFSFLDLGLKRAGSSDFGLSDFKQMLDYISDSFDNPEIKQKIEDFKSKLMSVNDTRYGGDQAAEMANAAAKAVDSATEAINNESQAATSSIPALQGFAKANNEISKSAELVSAALEKVVSVYGSLSRLDFAKLIDKEQLDGVVIDLENSMESMQDIFKQFGEQGLSAALSKLKKDQIKNIISNNNLNTTQQGLSKLKKDELIDVTVEGIKKNISNQQMSNNLNEELNSIIGIIEKIEESFMEEARIVDQAMNMNVASVDKVISSLGEFSDWLHLLIDEVQQLQKDNPDFLLPINNILDKAEELKNLASILKESKDKFNMISEKVGAKKKEQDNLNVPSVNQEMPNNYDAATDSINNFGHTAQKQLEQIDHLEGEVVDDAIAISNAFEEGRQNFEGSGDWQSSYDRMMGSFRRRYENTPWQYQSAKMNVSPDFTQFYGGTVTLYNDQLKQGVVIAYQYNEALGRIVETQIQINDSGKMRQQDLQKTLKKTAEFKEALANIASVNQGLDISDQVSSINDLIYKFANGAATIEEVQNAINSLKTSISNIKADLKGGGSSLNEVTNAVNLLKNAENDISSFKLDLDKLIDPPDEIISNLKILEQLLDEIQSYDIENNGINKDSAQKIKNYLQLRSKIQNDLKVAQKENTNQVLADSYRQRLETISPSFQETFSDEYANLIDRVTSLNKQFLEGTDGVKLGVERYKELMNDAFKNFSKATKIGLGKQIGGQIIDVNEAKQVAQDYVSQFKTIKKELQFSDAPTADGIYKFTAQVRDASGEVQNLAFTYSAETQKMAVSTKTLGTELTGFPALFDNIKNKVKDLAVYWTARLLDPTDILRYSKQIFSIIQQYDDALTEMRKVSDESVSSLKSFQVESFSKANEVGTTALQLQQSTADWLRLGENFQEAQKSAQTSNILLNVSEFTNISEATEALTSASQAYKEFEKIDIVDKLNNIGNNFSVSTDQLAKGLQNAAAVLKTQGNDLDQALALLTSGNAITQDISKTSAGVRTISLRISGTEEAKDEIKDMGEDIDDFVVRTKSKTDAIIRDYTAVAKNNYKGVSVLDDNGNLRSTYDILLDIAEVYEDIQKMDKERGTNRAQALVETLAGKNRSNIAASILSNPQMLKDVYEMSKQSEGSAQEELDKYLDSISGKMQKLTNQLHELANIAIDSDGLKVMLDVVNALLSGVTSLAKQFGVINTVIGGIVGISLQRKGKGKSRRENALYAEHNNNAIMLSVQVIL